jgi:hypothetical protein
MPIRGYFNRLWPGMWFRADEELKQAGFRAEGDILNGKIPTDEAHKLADIEALKLRATLQSSLRPHLPNLPKH